MTTRLWKTIGIERRGMGAITVFPFPGICLGLCTIMTSGTMSRRYLHSCTLIYEKFIVAPSHLALGEHGKLNLRVLGYHVLPTKLVTGFSQQIDFGWLATAALPRAHGFPCSRFLGGLQIYQLLHSAYAAFQFLSITLLLAFFLNFASSIGSLFLALQSVETESLLEPIHSAEEIPVCIHGTYKRFLEPILASGLKRMNRLHIHFTCGLPSDGEVISGMRRDVNLLIFIDTKKAMEDGMKFYKSENAVLLTEGFDGVVPAKYFQKIESWPNRKLVPFQV